MVYRQSGVIIAEGGRENATEQLSPLTMRAGATVDEIRMEKRTGEVVPNVNRLIFTRDDGDPLRRNDRVPD